MKVILVADIHAHNWMDFSSLVEYQGEQLNSRLVDGLRVLRKVRVYARDNDIGHVIVAGDLFHRRRLIDVSVFNAVGHEILALSNVAKVFLLVGNHDMVKRSWEGDHALSMLGSIPGVTVVDRPRFVGRIGLVPYSDDPEEIKGGLEQVDGASALVMHAGVLGAKTGLLEYQPPEPLKLSDLPSIPIYLGHYHKPHKVADHVTYIGAPMEHIRGEPHVKRGFAVLDMDDPSKIKRVILAGMPQFLTVEDVSQATAGDVKGHFVDLVVPTDEADEAGAREEKLTELGARAVVVQYVAPERAHKARLKVRTTQGLPDPRELCEAYVEQFASAGLDAGRLLKLAKEALDSTEVAP